jgi:nicotinamide-nucleotide amidase
MHKELMEITKEIMTRKKLTVSVAESLTSGNLQVVLGSISGASNFYEGGVTAYSLERKVDLLRIDEEHAKKVDCVSQRVAKEMAQGICNLFKTNIGLATTGYAEKWPESKVNDPTAFIAIHATVNNISEIVFECEVNGNGLDRINMQKKVTTTTIEALVNYLKLL